MTTTSIPTSHLDLLTGTHTAAFTTVGASGQPQTTAIWFLLDDGVLKTSLAVERQKYKNLTANPLATLFVIDPTNPQRTIEVRATATIAPDPDYALLMKLAAHYGVEAQMLIDFGPNRVVVTLTPSHIVAI